MSAAAPGKDIPASLAKGASKLVNDPIAVADKKVGKLMRRVEMQFEKQVRSPYGTGYWGGWGRQSPADHMMTLLSRNATREFDTLRTDDFLDPR
jgi:hypothetical protein